MKALALIEHIKQAYLNKERYSMHKYVHDFYLNGVFVGDYFNYFIFEPVDHEAPRIYHTFGPYDTITKKAPQQAFVFRDGNVELNTDFSEYVDMRTGIMDTLLLQSLKVTTLQNTRIVFFGSGKIAKWSLKFLKEVYPELEQIDFVNASGRTEDFVEFASKFDIKANYQNRFDIGLYDLIICHTNTNIPLLSSEDIKKIKMGAVITSYRTTSEHGELVNDFYATTRANVITDWEDSLDFAKDLKAATAKGILDKEKVMYLVDIFSGKVAREKKQYTVFRSTGTPMQNLAILQLIMKEGSLESRS